MNYSDLASSRWFDVKQTAFAWIDAVSKFRPETAVVGLGVTFLLTCERFGVSPRRVLEVSERQLRRAFDLEPQYPRAVQEYLAQEMRDGSA
jgi:hypothetical protein